MALARPRPVARDAMLTALWNHEQPPTAVKSMQAYVSRLRSVAGDAITSTGTGYSLRADVDLETAEQLVAEANRHVADCAPGAAAQLFGNALELWSGPSLADVAPTRPMDLERARLDEFARTTAEARMDALLAAGQGPSLVGELEVMVDEEPLRERRWAHLLVALHRSGRQADALRAYSRLRLTLVEELGIEPSAELQELEHRILTGDTLLGPGEGQRPRASLDLLDARSSTSTSHIPLPARIGPPTPFAGRGAEVARLEEAWDRATTHGRRGVMVAGEPGIGKTTLVSRFARAVHDNGAAVVVGECSADAGVAYRPWIELLAPLVEHLPEEILVDHVVSYGGVLARLAPALERRIELPSTPDLEAEQERSLLFDAVVDLLGRTPDPLLVVIDDLHWADRSSARLLRHVISSPVLPDVLVVAAYRPTDVGHTDPLSDVIAELRLVDGVTFIALGGLDDRELLDLLATTGHELEGGGIALRDALAAETGGNPFFALEIVRHLAETGAISRVGDSRRTANEPLTLGLPVSVRQVIGQRVARLGGTTHRVLRAAAVIGRHFDVDALAAVAEISPDELVELLDIAAAASVVFNSEGDRFHFSHALFEHALYAELLPARRARTHRSVAMWLEQRCGPDPGHRSGELAHHWAEAAPIAGSERAIWWARRAGDHAMSTLAPDEAVRWYRRALDLIESGSVDDDELRRTLHVALGSAERNAGDPVHRRRLLDAARLAKSVGDVEVLVEAALANNSGVYSVVGDVDAERVAVLEEALTHADDADHLSRARLLATLSAELTFDGSERPQRLAAQAVDAARRCGDLDTLCDVLNLTEITRRVPWSLDERDRCTLEAIDLTANDPIRQFNAALKRHHVLLVKAERAEARRMLEEAATIADRLGLPTLHSIIRTCRVLDAVLDGDLELAEARAADALERGTRADQVDAFTRYSAQLMTIRQLQGRLDELVPAITSLTTDKPTVPTFRAALASAHARAGDVDQARPIFAELTNDLDGVAADPIWSTHMGLLADTAILLDDHEVAADIYGRLLPYGDQISVVVGVACDGAISHRLGRLADLIGRRSAARRHLTTALDRHRRLESPLHVAATELELGRLAS